MKAVFIEKHGGREALRYGDIAEPAIGPEDALVRICATSVNRVDTLVRNGYPGLTVALPHITGGDAAGTVERVGGAVNDFAPGDRVVAWPLIACETCENCRRGKEHICFNWQFIGMHRHGSYAEFAAIPARSLIRLPESVTFEHAAALPTAGLVPMHGFSAVAQLQPGETFFMWGGSSGVGSFAVQIAKHLGATVFATAGTKEKTEIARRLGADYVFNHNTDDVQAEVLKLTGGIGVDVIIDFVGPLTFPKSFAMLKKGGRMMLCGIITGRETTLPLHLTYLQQKKILGLYLGRKQDLETLVQLTARKQIAPLIYKTMPLARAAEAQAIMESGEHYGKIILVP